MKWLEWFGPEATPSKWFVVEVTLGMAREVCSRQWPNWSGFGVAAAKNVEMSKSVSVFFTHQCFHTVANVPGVVPDTGKTNRPYTGQTVRCTKS